ncbi:assimilatory nitrite reductase subunit [Paeniglutamicibacter gangotriensis]|uniref:Assimilatory nitrite reductase subunit n=1 Tax=Paeniglutamicibacter gangotriensis TaxID=254787 RepID=A0A5B0ED93_9MICC|nr:FAD-dependent oxidoreductase [Paeniglutamicibacter gangotriensis]KAA0976175.1 assimilatory nitrite reductase subunit [Paeniglutamicibacter gangotriensis]
MSIESILVIGGGLAGFTVAQNLRARGYAGALGIIDPAGIPYDRPPLSKAYLLGQKDTAGIALAPAEWYAEHRVELIRSTVRKLDTEYLGVELADGRRVHADRLVLATGGSPRPLPIPGGDLETVLALRNKEDADVLREKITPGMRLVIVGAGLIGAEVASSARTLGAEVTLIDPVAPPLVPAVGQALARRLHAMHLDAGITLVHGTPVDISKTTHGHSLILDDGRSIDCDEVLVGIGIVPNTALAQAAGLETENGVLVDENQRTSNPLIYAVGDMARTRNPDGSLERRGEHWEYAMNTGATAAAAILEQELPVHGASWFWSDRHGTHVEGVGDMNGVGATVLRLAGEDPIAAFHLAEDGRMLGAASIDGGLTIRAARRIIDRGIIVPPESLADPGIALKKLAR